MVGVTQEHVGSWSHTRLALDRQGVECSFLVLFLIHVPKKGVCSARRLRGQLPYQLP